jgi:hypothetical protein
MRNSAPILRRASSSARVLISSRFFTIISALWVAATSFSASCTRGAIRLSKGSPAYSWKIFTTECSGTRYRTWTSIFTCCKSDE